MNKLIPLLFLALFSLKIFSQEFIDVQRPTQTESYTIIAPGVIQAENGIGYSSIDTLYGNTFFRLGLSERIEFRAATDFTSRFLDLGAKVVLLHSQKARPGISFILNYDFHKGVQNYTFSTSNSLGSSFFYTFNLGHDTDWYTIYLLGKSLGDKTASYVELYLGNNYEQLNAGITHRINNDIQIDLSGGLLDFNDFYVSAGFSFRIIQK